MTNTEYVELASKKPVTRQDITKKHPGTLLPRNPSSATLARLGYAKVKETRKPQGDMVEPGAPVERDGVWHQTWRVRDFTAEETAERFERARESALERINAEYAQRAAAIAAGYPAEEQQSWPIQIREADAVLSGSDMPTPWIDSAASSRNVSREELARLINEQDAAYRAEHGRLTGMRQALRDRIQAVPEGEAGLATLNTINWPE